MDKTTSQQQLSEKLLAYRDTVSDETLTHQAYLTIRHAIHHLELKPEKSFLEREIAEMLDISRTPVHSALIRLEMDGWLEIIPRKGIKVAPIEAQNIKEISQITEVLDGVAVELAMNVLSNEQLDFLEELILKQEEYLFNNDLNGYVDVDHQFHGLITNHSKNTALINMLENYSDQLFRARLYTIENRKFQTRSIKEHRAIVASIRAENGPAARKLMERHRHRGNKEIVNIIENK